MPFVNIKITKDGVTKSQKAELVKGVTDLLVRVLGKNPKTTHVVIEEIELDNWGFDSRLVSDIRADAPKD
jgi:4-oxalocrotonate tautomerase